MPDHAFALVNTVATADLDRLLGILADDGATVVRFHGDGVTDKASFLTQADGDFPRPPDLHPHNWDAFADTLWNGLADMGDGDIAIIWTDAHELARGDLQDFLMAVEIISR